VNAKMKDGTTALLAASRRGYTDVATYLLDNGADPHIKGEGGLTALMAASASGFKDVVFMLLERTSIDVSAVDSNGWSALTMAADRGWYQIAAKLIASGANVNVRSTFNWTPLMSACSNGFLDVAELLIAKGADVDVQQDGGWSALMISANAGHAAIVEALLKAKATIHNTKEDILPKKSEKELQLLPDTAIPLIGAATGGHADVVTLLLSRGANPNCTGDDGRTPLMIAASRGSKATVSALVKHGAGVPILSDFGYTFTRLMWVQVRGALGAGHIDDERSESEGELVRVTASAPKVTEKQE
jgi:ankyrin repeat protein